MVPSPRAEPFVVTGLRMSAAIALILVVSTEFLAGSSRGNGRPARSDQGALPGTAAALPEAWPGRRPPAGIVTSTVVWPPCAPTAAAW